MDLPFYKRYLGRIKQEHLALAVFAFLIAAFYGNTLFNGFVHDDLPQVVKNEYVHSLRYLPKVVTGCIWEFELGDCAMYYRPIQSLSYLLTYQISSNPWIFHLVNIFYFFAAVWLVFILIGILTKNFLLAFLSALIFLIHPINTESVDWVSSVPELTFTIFILLSSIFYVKYRLEYPSKKIKGLGKSSHQKSFIRFLNFYTMVEKLRKPEKLFTEFKKFFSSDIKNKVIFVLAARKNILLATLFYFLAMLSKEPAVLLPIIFIFLDFFILKPPITIKRFFSAVEPRRYFILASVFVVYLAMRIVVLRGLVQGIEYYGAFSAGERIYAFFTLFVAYLGKLFYPNPLIFFYSFEKSSIFLSPQFLISFFAVFIFSAALFVFARKSLPSIFQYFEVRLPGKNRGSRTSPNYSANKLTALALLWIFIFIFPAFIFLDSVGENIFSERYLLAPSIGFALILSFGLEFLIKKKDKLLRTSGIVILTLTVVFSWWIVYNRNILWKGDFSLYVATLAQNPDAHGIRRNFAVELTDVGNYDRAESELKEIMARKPDWGGIHMVYNNLGDVYRKKGDLDGALYFYGKLEEVSGGMNYKAYNNIGGVWMERGNSLKAMIYFCRAMQVDPAAREPQMNFSRVASLLGSVSDDGLNSLYNDIANGDTFQKSRTARIAYQQRSCSGEQCSFLFSSSFAQGEVILPFLILGISAEQNSANQVFRVSNPAFNPQTSEIMLETDPKYKDAEINFLFPTCEGKYYEAAAS